MEQSVIKPSRLHPIFFPYASQKQQEAFVENKRFVHYTSAETAISIIQNKAVWMRNVRCMNDYMEVEYGLSQLLEVYNKSASGDKFRVVLNNIFPDIIGEIESLFNSWLFRLKTDTYITCISEHLTEEDKIGRLSMWRAYGKNAGIALVLNNKNFLSHSDVLKIYTSPVGYFEEGHLDAQFKTITESILREADYIKAQPRESIISQVFNMFMFAILCTKHPGFREEKEWRIVYCPSIMQSNFVKKEVRSVSGIPQQIYTIPLISVPEEKFHASIPDLIERIIVGPTEYSLEIYKAIVELLSIAGVSEPEKKVVGSNIPLRRQ